MNGIYLLLGTNIGEKKTNLQQAIMGLKDQGIGIKRLSSVYETEPWGKGDQPWFLNVVVEVQTTCLPQALLDICLNIEERMGRVRKEKWGERLIDIDVLFYNNETLQNVQLALPHPGILYRKFTLVAMAELAAEQEHPVLGKSISELLSACTDTLQCRKTAIVLEA